MIVHDENKFMEKWTQPQIINCILWLKPIIYGLQNFSPKDLRINWEFVRWQKWCWPEMITERNKIMQIFGKSSSTEYQTSSAKEDKR